MFHTVSADAETATSGRVGKASPSVSVFARAPLCPNTCRHCRCKLCDIATAHDDYICTIVNKGSCFLNEFPSGKSGICPSVTLTLGARNAPPNDVARRAHEYHLCMQCKRRGVVFLAPAGGEDPWAAKEDRPVLIWQ